MENTAYAQVRIENAKFGRRGLFLTGCAFFGSFIILCFVAASAPAVFAEHNSGWSTQSIEPVPPTNEAYWVGQFTDLSTLNQMLWLTSIFRRNGDISASITYDLEITYDLYGIQDNKEDLLVDQKTVTRTIECPAKDSKCKEFLVFSLERVLYEAYRVEMTFEAAPDELTVTQEVDVRMTMHVINPAWTHFDMGWKYFFLAATLLAMFLPYKRQGYVLELMAVDRSTWTSQQWWVLALLCGLVFYNDPFYAAEVYTPATVSLASLYIFFMATFVCLLLHFWLCVLDDFRREAQEVGGIPHRRGILETIRYHSPKLSLVFAIWVLLLATFMYVRVQRNHDPTYDGVGDTTLQGAEIVLALATSIYAVWLAYLLIAGANAIKNLSPPFRLIFLLTVFTILAAIVGIFGGFLYPIPTIGIDFLAFYALFNLYIWTLAFAYAPLKDEDLYSPGFVEKEPSEVYLQTPPIMTQDHPFTISDDEDDDHVEL